MKNKLAALPARLFERGDETPGLVALALAAISLFIIAFGQPIGVAGLIGGGLALAAIGIEYRWERGEYTADQPDYGLAILIFSYQHGQAFYAGSTDWYVADEAAYRRQRLRRRLLIGGWQIPALRARDSASRRVTEG